MGGGGSTFGSAGVRRFLEKRRVKKEGFRKQLMRLTASELGALVGVCLPRVYVRAHRRRRTHRQTHTNTCLPRHVTEKVLPVTCL